MGEMVQTFVRRLTVAAAIGMFIVLIQGALVTTTESAEGCGKSWPLCKGEFVPSYAVETMIEFAHRFVVAIETVLIVGAGIGIWYFWRNRREIRIYAPIMVGFLVIQALLGAAAVMWPQTAEILALHFGISLIAFASVVLAAIFLYEEHGWDRLRDRPLPQRFRLAAFSLLGYTYFVVYIGAYVRHKEVSMACEGWPLCNGEVVPSLTGDVGIVFWHRVAAMLLSFAVAGMFIWAWRIRASRPDIFWASALLGGLIVLQSMSGAFVVWTQLDIFTTMSHGLFVSLFFGALCYLCLHTLPRPAAVRTATVAESPATSADPRGREVQPAS